MKERYKVSKYVYNKLSELEDFICSDSGEWESSKEEVLMQTVSDICVSFQNLIDALHREK